MFLSVGSRFKIRLPYWITEYFRKARAVPTFAADFTQDRYWIDGLEVHKIEDIP